MQITLNLDETIAERLQAEAKRRGTTASALAEAGIREILGEGPVADENRDTLSNVPRRTNLVDTPEKQEFRRVMEEYFGGPAPQTAEELFERLPKWNSGGELVDITNKEELYRVMDEDDGFRY
ncbi:hypothetical protein GBAR_LOCUS4264 [Geodia barretti]|jgi:hypothetical protein|uniref:Ribbon-helix-helix protein CopG domain-containing protein n=1 Tax=Geodia barretti TaxID=519541 RepID=A0AA35R7D1_GEOBA|nr:hypothetical protein GBAR_LOCUS4264 [Geodia barretti]